MGEFSPRFENTSDATQRAEDEFYLDRQVYNLDESLSNLNPSLTCFRIEVVFTGFAKEVSTQIRIQPGGILKTA
jgi:hypothetical protein